MKELKTSENGLDKFEVAKRQEQYGLNKLKEVKRKSSFRIFLEQFKSFLVIILIIATAISIVLDEVTDAIVILIILILNAALGFYQEKKAENALEALKRLTVPKAKVVREGKTLIIDSHEIVPGDILLLDTGDKVPADCRIINETNLKTNESVLTGESTPVRKHSDAIKKEHPAISDQKNILFSGTTIVYGHCKAVVIGTGMNTEFGKIATLLQVPEEETPLQKKLAVLGKHIGIIVIAISVVIFVMGYFSGENPLKMLIIAVALAVAAIPESLPASITIALSLGVYRMSKKNSIVRRLASVETLGSTTVICSDKTGTLTMNEMTVRKIYVDNKIFDVSGEGFLSEGKIELNGKELKNLDEYKDLQLLLVTGVMCNDAISENDNMIGDPTELALLVSAKKAHIEDLRKEYKRIEEIPFDSSRKMMSTAYSIGGKKIAYSKGAVESVLSKCSHIYTNGKVRKLTTQDKKNILKINEIFAKSALRVLAFAVKRMKENEKLIEKNLIFIGLQGMIDPPRPEVKDAIKLCKDASIKVVMITGDHEDTAVAIAKELDILDDGKILTGAELEKMNDNEFNKIVNQVSVYARVSPEHKVRITKALKNRGHIVAMTGDGINDAPALKQADIGVSMGITGTDVTKEASDMILTDDNFTSIVSAVEEGRGIYDNIRKVIAYLLSGNIVEVAIISLSIFMGMPLPLIAIQILWINLVTDGLPALALSMDPIDKDVMKKKPRPKNESIWHGMRPWMVEYVVIAVAITLGLFAWGLQESLIKAQTLVFTSIIIFEKYQSISCRSLDKPVGRRIFENKFLIFAIALTIVLQLAILYIPFLNPIFGVTPLSLFEWLLILGGGAIAYAYLEIYKWLKSRKVPQ